MLVLIASLYLAACGVLVLILRRRIQGIENPRRGQIHSGAPGTITGSGSIGRVHGVNRRALHLLWTIPLAVLVSLPMVLVASISLCGISGCSGAGFGVTTQDQYQTWVFCGLIGLVFVAAVSIPGWLYPRTVRVLVAGLVGGAVGGALTLNYLSQLATMPS